MASSSVRFAAALALAASSGVTAAQETEPPDTCTISAESWSLDAQTSRSVFRGVRVTCEDTVFTADEATAAEVVPQEGEWQLRGNIRIEKDTTVITADTATFRFTENELLYGELVGSPAALDDFIEEENTAVRATAGRIYYDNVGGTARMEGGASLVYGTSEMSGCGGIIYDLDRELVDSIADCDEPFVIKFLPDEDSEPDAPAGSPDAAPNP